MKILLFVCLTLSTAAFAQMGLGTTTPAASAALDISATNRALLIPRVANILTITTPVDGMIIYDIASRCVRAYENGAWSNCINGTAVASLTSNGTAVVSSFVCSTGSAGTMTAGFPASGVTQTITATVTTAGTYSISATANEVTFSGSGTFSGTGAQNVVLTATGTPPAYGPFNYVLNTTPSCSFTRQHDIPTITSTTNKVWMARNLGATRVAISTTDRFAYGDLYQWGRNADGHERITWTSASAGIPVNGTTTTRPGADQAANALFITISSGNSDWRGTTQNNNLWQGAAGINNPCPAGFRLPTTTEINAEATAYSITNSIIAFSSIFKFPMPGSREHNTGNLAGTGSAGRYWTSTISGTLAVRFGFNPFTYNTTTINPRATGFAVRCIKD